MVGRDETGIAVGDVVITSGIAEVRQEDEAHGWGLMPRGLPVGQVTKINQTAASLFLDIRIRALASLRRNETLFVVGAQARQDSLASRSSVAHQQPGGPEAQTHHDAGNQRRSFGGDLLRQGHGRKQGGQKQETGHKCEGIHPPAAGMDLVLSAVFF